MNLKIDPRLVPHPTRGQLALLRAEQAELSDGNEEPQYEDIHNRLNRHERRVVASEARAHKRKLVKKAALKLKRSRRALVEL